MDAEIEVGRIGRPHGLRGHVVVTSGSSDSDILLQVGTVTLDFQGKRERRAVRDSRMQGKLLLLAFEGVPDRTAAEKLHGATVYLRESELPPPADGEFYAAKLIGLSVESPTGAKLGKVVEIESSGAQNWLVVETPHGRRLVPFAEPLARVELQAGRVVIDAPEGLLDE